MLFFFFFSSRRRHTRSLCDWSSDVCSSDLRWPAVLAWVLWALAIGSLGVNWWQDHLLRQAGRPDLAALGAGVVAPILAAVSAATVGAVLASRRPRHPVGWL